MIDDDYIDDEYMDDAFDESDTQGNQTVQGKSNISLYTNLTVDKCSLGKSARNRAHYRQSFLSYCERRRRSNKRRR